MEKRRKIIGLFLLMVYAYFFASTNFFYHTHQLANSKIVHSHPFHGQTHTHTPGQIFVISLFDAAVYQKSSDITVPDIVPLLFCQEMPPHSDKYVSAGDVFSFSLRAPPVWS